MDKEVDIQIPNLTLVTGPSNDETAVSHAYEFLNDVSSLQTFMKSYAFVVWDYMCLLKTLQNRVTCVTVPWVPSEQPNLTMAINRLVCREEADTVADGLILSRFELFLKAMVEVGADTTPILAFLNGLKRGRHPLDALATLPIPAGTKAFLSNNISLYKEDTYRVAAAFLYGHTDMASLALRRAMLDIEAELGKSCYWLRLYLTRVLDHTDCIHGPVIRNLLAEICGNSSDKWKGASESAKNAFKIRQELLSDLFINN